ncbi:MAG: hypothetical protein WC124_10345 [Desulfoplanes sp.]|jgi:hypothetical protein
MNSSPPDPAQRVRIPDILLDHIGNQQNIPVSLVMPKTIIDVLEVIKIHIAHEKLFAAHFGSNNLHIDT